MDLIIVPCTLQRRTFRKMNFSFQEPNYLAKTTPIKNKSRMIYTTSPETRLLSSVGEKKFEDKGINCDLFENQSISKTFQCNIPKVECQHNQIFQEQKQLSKKQNGLVIFKPVPRGFSLKTQYNSPKIRSESNSRRKRFGKQLECEALKTTIEKEKLFSDRNCRIYLNNLWQDSYIQ